MIIDWTQIAIAFIGLLGTIVTVVLVPYYRENTTKAQRDNVEALVTAAVWAADQMLKQSDPTGIKRKEYVIDYLATKNVRLTLADLDMMIEAAVVALNFEQLKSKSTQVIMPSLTETKEQ